MTLVGALKGLSHAGITPDIVTGISSGGYAGYMAYGGLEYEAILSWFEICRGHLKSRPVRRFFPPWDIQAVSVQKVSEPYLVSQETFLASGLSHLYIGYTKLKNFSFHMEDIISISDTQKAYNIVMKSSTIPFVTHHAPFLDGAIDGGFSKAHFPSPHKVNARWLLTYDSKFYPIRKKDKEIYDRIFTLKTPIVNPIRCSKEQLVAAYHVGFEQGLAIGYNTLLASYEKKHPSFTGGLKIVS